MDRDPPPAGAIEDYVAELQHALRLRPLLRRRLTAEVREHLEDAAHAEQRAGHARADAERHAVAAFGSARALATAYRAPRPSRALVGTTVATAAVAAIATAVAIPRLETPRTDVRAAVTAPGVPALAETPAPAPATPAVAAAPPAVAGSGFALLAAYTEDGAAPRWQELPTARCAGSGAEAPLGWTLHVGRALSRPRWQLTGTAATAGPVRVVLADGRALPARRTGARFAAAAEGPAPVAVLLRVAGRDCRVDLPPLPDAGLA
jgi:hypothetical protein